MYLHRDKELFIDVIEATSNEVGLPVSIVEKDYYVTMILKELSKRNKNVVFKGGTSLSKCFNIINRFSEDIDITFDIQLGEARRQNIKNRLMSEIGKDLDLKITNINEVKSKAKFNCYNFQYDSIHKKIDKELYPGIKLETVMSTYAFPTIEKEVDSYVRKFLIKENKDIIEEYGLDKFKMKVQSLERTFIDKIFALCDYYLQGKSERYSRHLYDIYKLNKYIKKNGEFKKLVKDVREHRKGVASAISAKEECNIKSIVHEFCDSGFYKKDYKDITGYFINDYVKYEDTIKCICNIVDEGDFDV